MGFSKLIWVGLFASLPVAANAADVSAPVDLWNSGFYVGVNGGLGAGKTSNDVNWEPEALFPPDLTVATHRDCSDLAAIFGPYFGSCDANGSVLIGGAQVGYNHLAGGVLLGVEADLDAANYDATSKLYKGGLFGGPASIEQSVDAIGTVRARVGYEIGNFVPYVTGGVAFVNSTLTLEDQPEGADFPGSPRVASEQTQWSTGWVAGAGIEYAVNTNWSVRAEYLHIQADSEHSFYSSFEDESYSAESKLEIDAGRIGINYHFN